MGPSRAAAATPVLVTMELSPCNFGVIKLSLRNGNGHVGDHINKAGLPAGANSDDTRRATAARLSLHLRQRCERLRTGCSVMSSRSTGCSESPVIERWRRPCERRGWDLGFARAKDAIE